MDYASMPTEELLRLRDEYKLISSKKDLTQKTMKISLNSLYGCLGNKFFAFYHLDMAEAITMTGQYMIKSVGYRLNDWINKGAGTDIDTWIASDTDSVVGDSVVRINGKDVTIADFYDSIPEENLIRNDKENENYVKRVEGVLSPSLNEQFDVQEKSVSYVMKHKVKKRMFRIKAGGKEVVVTEDHSVMVRDGDVLKAVKPKDIDVERHETVELIDEKHIIFGVPIVEDLGVQEVDVYDIEVVDNHNFFANGICVHNSVYMNLSGFVKKYCSDMDKDQQIDKIVAFADGPVNKEIRRIVDEASSRINLFQPSALSMEREAVCDGAVFVKKKKYVLSIVDQEGIRQNPAKIKITGLESKKAIISQPIRKALEDCYKIVIRNPDELVPFVENFKKTFSQFPVEEIATISSVNNVEKFVDKSKGVPMHVKAALVHNRYIKEKGIEEFVNPIQSGDKIKVVALKMPNPTRSPVFAFENEWSSAYELDSFIDMDTQFEKAFMSPLKNFTDATDFDPVRRETFELF